MPFETILKDLTARTGATGAIMLDWEGEAVNMYSTSGDLKLDAIAAHNVIVLNMLKELTRRNGKSHNKGGVSPNGGGVSPNGRVESLGIVTGGMKLAISTIREDYYLLLALERKRSMARAFYESRRAVRRIVEEIG